MSIWLFKAAWTLSTVIYLHKCGSPHKPQWCWFIVSTSHTYVHTYTLTNAQAFVVELNEALLLFAIFFASHFYSLGAQTSDSINDPEFVHTNDFVFFGNLTCCVHSPAHIIHKYFIRLHCFTSISTRSELWHLLLMLILCHSDTYMCVTYIYTCI